MLHQIREYIFNKNNITYTHTRIYIRISQNSKKKYFITVLLRHLNEQKSKTVITSPYNKNRKGLDKF